MPNLTLAIVDRIKRIHDATDAVQRYDKEGRIEAAQYELAFEEGIKVANDVTAEMIADLHHLFDYHGQDWDALLDLAAAKYKEHQEQALHG